MYRCFSSPQKEFLKKQGHRFLFSAFHMNGKKFWVFNDNKQFKNDLEIWRKNRPIKKD